MNRIIKIMVLALLLGLVSMFQSCSSWLDIMPEAQVNDEKMFSTQQGFKDVLNGIYITASSEKLYANNLLFGFVDALAQYYEIPDEEHEFAKVAKYEYKDVEVSPKIDEMWLELYFCIANCNILLERLEEVGPTFFEDERVYYVMHGEVLALRAFFHFDLLRLWAPSYKKDPNYMAIPYITAYSNKISPQYTVAEVIDSVIVDLKAAALDLKDHDPIFDPIYQVESNGASPADMYMWTQPMPDRDEFLSYRGYRMNYYAVTTTLARIYLYIEDNENAFDWAELAVNTGKCSSTSYIFSLYSDKLSDYSDYYFNPNLEKEEQLIIEVNKKDTIYETDKYGSIDSRLKEWFNYYPNSSTEFVSKYMKSSDGSTPVNIALIRGCEAYYIAAEAASNIEDAFERLNRVRQAFGISATYDLQAGVEDLNKELFAEYQKSFVAEGQLFYYMKRKNFSQISGVSGVTFPALYTFPIPDTEIEFGNISD